jgi:hypothetical protein
MKESRGGTLTTLFSGKVPNGKAKHQKALQTDSKKVIGWGGLTR